MKVQALTTFPNIFDSYINESIMKRAQEKGKLEFQTHNLRDWTYDVHRTTDDYVYGGGEGLIMKCEPIYSAISDLLSPEFVKSKINCKQKDDDLKNNFPRIIIPAPQGVEFSDELACELSKAKELFFICGHYEGIDERVFNLADDIISIGDYVLSSGELSSMVIIDAVVRKIPGVLGAESGAVNESFAQYLLEQPQYTRPESYLGMEVPSVLLSGNHDNICEFNRKEAIKRTWKLRPDLIEKALRANVLTESELNILNEIKSEV